MRTRYFQSVTSLFYDFSPEIGGKQVVKAGSHSPKAGRRISIARYQFLLTGNDSLNTGNYSPNTGNQLPITGNHSPATGIYSSIPGSCKIKTRGFLSSGQSEQKSTSSHLITFKHYNYGKELQRLHSCRQVPA